MSLYVWISDVELRNDSRKHFKNRLPSDSGLDILCRAHSLKQKFAAEIHTNMYVAAINEEGDPIPCLLVPRSSISSTPLRMSNGLGLIDAGYRGELIAKVDIIDGSQTYDFCYGRRLFQVCQYNFLPWKKIIFVDSISFLPESNDSRGDKGFGSTGI